METEKILETLDRQDKIRAEFGDCDKAHKRIEKRFGANCNILKNCKNHIQLRSNKINDLKHQLAMQEKALEKQKVFYENIAKENEKLVNEGAEIESKMESLEKEFDENEKYLMSLGIETDLDHEESEKEAALTDVYIIDCKNNMDPLMALMELLNKQ